MKFIILIFHSIVQLALFILILKKLYIVIKFISSSKFENFLLKLEKTIVKYKVASIFLLKLTKFSSAFQLKKEYSSFYILFYIEFLFLIFKKFLILFKILEDIEFKLDRVARSNVITNDCFVSLSLYF